MSNPLAKLREDCEQAYPGVELPEAKYGHPPNPEMGELSSPVCFQLARVVRQRPADIAQTLVENIAFDGSRLVRAAEAVNGYVNFKADTGNYSKLVLETAIKQNEEYGFVKT